MTKVLTIVGAGPGLGTELTRRFGAAGYSVGLIARDQPVLDSMRSELSDVRIATAVGDVTDADALRAAIDACAAELGPADVVMSNTSMLVEAPPTQVPLGVFETTWRVACLSTLIALQHVAPGMVEKGSGVFLVPGTALALNPWAPGVSLGAAKAAARNLVMCAHDELKPSGVHASMVTIKGAIAKEGPFAPDQIANRFYEVASLSNPDDWQREIVYTG